MALEGLRSEMCLDSQGVVSAGLGGASIAVLPFASLSSDPDDEFFADGITGEITNALARIEDLRVASRSSAFAFKGQHADLRAVGDRLKVKAVLEGSFRRSGNRVRLTARLSDVSDGYHRWSESYDRQLKDILELQDDLVNAVAERLLYDLIGGKEAVGAAVELFYRRALKDDRINPFFRNANFAHLREHMTQLLSALLGARAAYAGRDLCEAHARPRHQGLKDAHFDAVLQHLRAVLEEVGVHADKLAKILKLLEQKRDAVLSR